VANECPSSADHVDGHGEALKQYMQHRPMQHVQGYTGSHWTLPSGDYLFHIALAAARATANKTTIYYVPTLMAILVVIACGGTIPCASPNGGGPGLSYATKHRHWGSTRSDRSIGHRNAAIWLDV